MKFCCGNRGSLRC